MTTQMFTKYLNRGRIWYLTHLMALLAFNGTTRKKKKKKQQYSFIDID